MVLLLVFMHLTRDLFAIAKFLFYIKLSNKNRCTIVPLVITYQYTLNTIYTYMSKLHVNYNESRGSLMPKRVQTL